MSHPTEEYVLHIHHRWQLCLWGDDYRDPFADFTKEVDHSREDIIAQHFSDVALPLYDVVYTNYRMVFLVSKTLKGLEKLTDPRESGWLALIFGTVAYDAAQAIAARTFESDRYNSRDLDSVIQTLHGDALPYSDISGVDCYRIRRRPAQIMRTGLSRGYVIRIAGHSGQSRKKLIVEFREGSNKKDIVRWSRKYPFVNQVRFHD
jgi:hypothetical protein